MSLGGSIASAGAGASSESKDAVPARGCGSDWVGAGVWNARRCHRHYPFGDTLGQRRTFFSTMGAAAPGLSAFTRRILVCAGISTGRDEARPAGFPYSDWRCRLGGRCLHLIADVEKSRDTRLSDVTHRTIHLFTELSFHPMPSTFFASCIRPGCLLHAWLFSWFVDSPSAPFGVRFVALALIRAHRQVALECWLRPPSLQSRHSGWICGGESRRCVLQRCGVELEL
ncbi:hypothetical protein C8F04DRAFT_1160246 [Mycena alexandri]|uniref:Uncharacterized protein n=1 Tax=Mycena alexandri TaxID=1745969 RepID=A0AAD6RWC2_9AGAR|nr:hypothetical protein C8F04DRAFT_1160246 [Mycena alexandri]